ncbi:MAG: catalase, partial [Pedobacter sp.]
RNPENFFAETEQVAFHVGHVVPGIDFTNDPLLQGRLFSYTDTQLIRLGGPNFHEIPINRPVVPVHNNQRDGFMRQTINVGKSSYGPNSIANNDPQQVKAADGGFNSYNERIDARKIRARSKSFFDHFSQAKLFFHSQSEFEQNHIIDALSFELGKVKTVTIRERMLGILAQIDTDLAKTVAANLGITTLPKPAQMLNHSIPADGDPKDYQPIIKEPSLKKSAALSMADTIKDTIKSRKIAFLIADGVDVVSVNEMKKALEDQQAAVELIAPKLGTIQGLKNQSLAADESFLTAASVLYDAVFIPSGDKSIAALSQEPDAIHFINQAFKHCKAIAIADPASALLDKTQLKGAKDAGLLIGNKDNLVKDFITAIAQHRVWEREKARKIPA